MKGLEMWTKLVGLHQAPLVIVAGMVVLGLVAVVAICRGAQVDMSFWPPKIGTKPKKGKE